MHAHQRFCSRATGQGHTFGRQAWGHFWPKVKPSVGNRTFSAQWQTIIRQALGYNAWVARFNSHQNMPFIRVYSTNIHQGFNVEVFEVYASAKVGMAYRLLVPITTIDLTLTPRYGPFKFASCGSSLTHSNFAGRVHVLVLSLFSHIMGFSCLLHIHHNVEITTKISQCVHMLRIMICFLVSSSSCTAKYVNCWLDAWIVSMSNRESMKHVCGPGSVPSLFSFIMGRCYLVHIHHNIRMLTVNQQWGYMLQNMICFDIWLLSHANASHSIARIHGRPHVSLEPDHLSWSVGGGVLMGFRHI